MTEKIMNKIAKCIMIAVMFLLVSHLALALGIGPSRQYISFAPGQTIQGELTIINDGKEDFKAAVYAQGELTDYIKIDAPLVDVSASEFMKQVPYTLKFPLQAPTPGEHRLEVVVRQFPAGTTPTDATTVTANMAVISQIIVKAPYPGKYAEGKLFISGSEQPDSPATFVIMLYNFGTEQIDSAQATIQIFSPNNEKVGEATTEKISVKPKEEGKLQTTWKPIAKGTYKAVVNVKYDDKEFRTNQDFDSGAFSIDVSDIQVKKFTLGDVAKFDMLLFNSWNTEMKDVYVEMTVADSIGNKMTEFKTAAVDIPAQQAKTLEAYWYTEGASPGIYSVKLIVHYAGKITQKQYDFEVNTNSITKLGAVGQAIGGQPTKAETGQGVIIMLILIVLVILVAMNVIWFYFLSKKIKGGGQQ